ncbi:MAG: isochorismatase family protein, partial [Proteobacteria bacterium]|nr:isochorismatase family protein [Pseudomonadota bacterium]
MDSATGDLGRKPWLLCLNLQREFIMPGRPFYAPAGPAAATSARRCLSRARDYGWTIVHVQTDAARRARSDEFARPIDGLEPLPSEPLFRIAQRSAFANDDLRNRVLSERPP